jgi:hypothetical protein
MAINKILIFSLFLYRRQTYEHDVIDKMVRESVCGLLYAGSEGHGSPHLQLQFGGQGLHTQLRGAALINLTRPPQTFVLFRIQNF